MFRSPAGLGPTLLARCLICAAVVAFAGFALGGAQTARAADGPEAAPPGIVIEPPVQRPGASPEEEDEDGPPLPGGPGCPVNKRPLELLV